MPIVEAFEKGADIIRLLHIIFPPGSLKICILPSSVLGTLSSIATFTNCLDNYKSIILTLSGISVPILYLISLYAYISTLDNRVKKANARSKKFQKKFRKKVKEYRKLKENRDGLKNQMHIYKQEIDSREEDVKNLSSIVERHRIIEQLMMMCISDDDILKLKNRIAFLERSDSYEKNESSKNNQH